MKRILLSLAVAGVLISPAAYAKSQEASGEPTNLPLVVTEADEQETLFHYGPNVIGVEATDSKGNVITVYMHELVLGLDIFLDDVKWKKYWRQIQLGHDVKIENMKIEDVKITENVSPVASSIAPEWSSFVTNGFIEIEFPENTPETLGRKVEVCVRFSQLPDRVVEVTDNGEEIPWGTCDDGRQTAKIITSLFNNKIVFALVTLQPKIEKKNRKK